MKGTIEKILGTVICLAGLAAWFYTAPAVGSGYILIVPFVSLLVLLNSIRKGGWAIVAAVLITDASGAAWWFNRELPDSGWVLGLSILCALAMLGNMLSDTLSDTRWKA